MVNSTQMTLDEFTQGIFLIPIAGASDSLVRTSASVENSSALKEVVQACFSELCTFLDSSKKKRSPLSCSLRMLKILLVLMEDGISPDFSLKWIGGGTMQSGKFSTLKTSEFPRTGSDVSLSDILEDEVDDKYFLSEKTVQRLMSYKDSQIIS